MEQLKTSSDTLFILLGAIMVLAMHAGFAFLELGTVRRKNQVNALMKILVDFSVSTLAYFFIGYAVAYGVTFFNAARSASPKSGYDLVKFFFLLTFAAAVPAIVSGGIAERARFGPQFVATVILVGFVYPFFEGIAWNQNFRFAGVVRRARSARSSMTSPARSSSTRSAAGLRSRPCCCSARASAATRKDGAVCCFSAVLHSVSRAGRVDAVGRLVRLQRDERADPRQDERARRDEFAHGDGGRHARGAGRRAATTRASCTTGLWPVLSPFARAPTSCIRSAGW